jgi:hypothetical protein
MEINMKINAGGITATTPAKRGAPKSLSPNGGDSFASTNALEGALKSLPDVRPDTVARARQLINDPDYPSASTVRQLSDFLAGKLQSSAQ